MARLPDPTSIDQYNRQIREHSATEGDAADPLLRIPCPFCTAPNFFVARRSEADDTFTQEHTCLNCKRTGKILLIRRKKGPPEAEFMQTAGEDPPAFLPIKRLT